MPVDQHRSRGRGRRYAEVTRYRGALILLATATVAAGCSSSSTPSSTTSGTRSSAPSATKQSITASVSPAAGTTALPLGDGKLSTAPRRGYVWSCQPANPTAPGASATAPWIRGDLWYPAQEPTVAGSVIWPRARFSVSVRGAKRSVTTDRLPVRVPTGIFPIASSDPAYRFDTNPNHINPARIKVDLPATPKAAAQPSCLGVGGIGITTDGVLLFDALDAQGRDAVAHEVTDRCDGHPDAGGVYHYHQISPCLLRTAGTGPTLVGYAFDGYGIYVEHDSDGQLVTDQDLDPCHGRTSPVPWNGAERTIYHYDATAEYPYTLGCYHGTSVIKNTGPPHPVTSP
jgi:hypothetical protein